MNRTVGVVDCYQGICVAPTVMWNCHYKCYCYDRPVRHDREKSWDLLQKVKIFSDEVKLHEEIKMKVTYVRFQRKSTSNIQNNMRKDHQVKDGLTHPRTLPLCPKLGK